MKERHIVGVEFVVYVGKFRACSNIEVEKDGGDDRALGYSKEELPWLGQVIVVGAAGCTPTKVGGEPTNYIAVEFSVSQAGDEGVMRDAVECFGEIDCYCRCAGRRWHPVEAFSDASGEGEEGRCCGMVLFETVLGGVGGKGFVEVGEEEALKHFGAWAEKGDGAVGVALVRWFSRFEEGNDGGGFPNGRNVGFLEGVVEEGCEVGNAFRAELFKVVDGEAIWTFGGGV